MSIDVKPIKQPYRESPAGFHYYQSYLDCPRKWYFNYAVKWRPLKKGKALLFGSAIHEAFDTFWKTDSADLMKAAGLGELEHNQEQYRERSDYLLDTTRMPKMLDTWLGTWEKVDKLQYELIESETSYTIDFADGLVLTVRPDRIMRDRQTGTYSVWDVKTTSYSVPKAYEAAEQNDQMTAYIWAVKKVHPEWQVLQAEIDVLYNRNSVFEAARPATIYRTQFDLDVFEMNMQGVIEEVTGKVEALKDTPYPMLFPRHGAFCGAFGCEFASICRSDVRPGQPIPDSFTSNEW